MLVGSLMVIALQTVVSREVNPAHPSVVTVGRFDAGTANNVIAGRAEVSASLAFRVAKAFDAPIGEVLTGLRRDYDGERTTTPAAIVVASATR